MVGNTENTQICRKKLMVWLKEQAHYYLLPWLEDLSRQTNLPYTKAIIRGQSTRWGSCSAHKAITLNYKLLFLPPYLVSHILIHELCHTLHLNHSQRFWDLVASFDPAYAQYRREARQQAHHYVPAWLE